MLATETPMMTDFKPLNESHSPADWHCHLKAFCLEKYVRPYLADWKANHAEITADVDELAVAKFESLKAGLRLCGETVHELGVDWLEQCKLPDDASEVDILVGRYMDSIRIDVTYDEIDYNLNSSEVKVLSELIYLFGGRQLETGVNYSESAKNESRYLRLILPTVARKVRSMRRCMECSDEEDTRQWRYYDHTVSPCCNLCRAPYFTKRVCRRL